MSLSQLLNGMDGVFPRAEAPDSRETGGGRFGSATKLTLSYANYAYHQEGPYDIIEDYDDWEGNEDNWSHISDEDYNRFSWLVEEGEEVEAQQHLATIKTRDEDCADDYWVILVAGCDGILHREIRNGKHAMDSGELAATVYESMEDYEKAVLATGKVKAKDSRVRKCPGCGMLQDGRKKFCGECGTRLIAEAKTCTGCGAKIEPGQKFCCECGTKAE